MNKKNYNPVKTLRIPQNVLDQIPQGNFSDWVLKAVKDKLESEKGLTPQYEKRLSMLLEELTAIGRNINQLTRAANSGRPVSLDSSATRKVLANLSVIKTEILEVKQKL